MLPTLAMIGTGLAWFAATLGQLIFWGAGITVGFWIGKKLTNVWDQWIVNRAGLKIFNRHQHDEAMAAAAAVASNS